MACQDDDYEAPAGYSDRELPRLIVDTRTRCHRGRFDVRQLDPPQQTLPNDDQWPSECSALPLPVSFSVYVFITLSTSNEIEISHGRGVVANTLEVFRNAVVGFIDWLGGWRIIISKVAIGLLR